MRAGLIPALLVAGLVACTSTPRPRPAAPGEPLPELRLALSLIHI
nr:hypothetical protein [Corallococcus exercitus]